jgi:hypothetical protein
VAIRDRVSIKTKDGSSIALTVSKQGGKLDTRWPQRGDTMAIFEVLDKVGNPTGEEVRVPLDQIMWVSYDQEPKAKKAKS